MAYDNISRIVSIIFFIFMLSFTIFMFDLIHTVVHENAHMAINELYDVDTISMEINLLSTSFVTANTTNIKGEERISFNEMQSMNEIIGYNVGMLTQAIIVSVGLISLAYLLSK